MRIRTANNNRRRRERRLRTPRLSTSGRWLDGFDVYSPTDDHPFVDADCGYDKRDLLRDDTP